MNILDLKNRGVLVGSRRLGVDKENSDTDLIISHKQFNYLELINNKIEFSFRFPHDEPDYNIRELYTLIIPTEDGLIDLIVYENDYYIEVIDYMYNQLDSIWEATNLDKNHKLIRRKITGFIIRNAVDLVKEYKDFKSVPKSMFLDIINECTKWCKEENYGIK